MQIKVDKYILRGGENLNTPAKASSVVTPLELEKYNLWADDLYFGEDDELYLDLPLSENSRLHIRRFKRVRRAQRMLYYYLGLVLDMNVYVVAGDCYTVSQAVAKLDVDNIARKFDNDDSELLPFTLEISQDFRGTSYSLGTKLVETKFVKLKDKFNEIHKCVMQSYCKNNIKEWFTCAFFAVNPCKFKEEYNVVIAKKLPQGFPMSNMSVTQNLECNLSNAEQSQIEATSLEMEKIKKNSKANFIKNCAILVVLLVVVLGFTVYGLSGIRMGKRDLVPVTQDEKLSDSSVGKSQISDSNVAGSVVKQPNQNGQKNGTVKESDKTSLTNNHQCKANPKTQNGKGTGGHKVPAK